MTSRTKDHQMTSKILTFFGNPCFFHIIKKVIGFAFQYYVQTLYQVRMDEIIVISSNSEEEELIPNVSEGANNEVEQTGRGKKRKAENQNVEQDYYQIKPVRKHH